MISYIHTHIHVHTVSHPIIAITRPLGSVSYVGLNYSLVCSVNLTSPLSGIEAIIEWTGPSGTTLTSSSNGRITVSDVIAEAPGSHYRIRVTFSPASSSDSGLYTCSITLRPVMDNEFVTNSMRSVTESLTVFCKY